MQQLSQYYVRQYSSLCIVLQYVQQQKCMFGWVVFSMCGCMATCSISTIIKLKQYNRDTYAAVVDTEYQVPGMRFLAVWA